MYTISYPSNTLRKDGVVIEQNENNPDYLEYVAWLSEGNGPEVLQDPPPPPPPPVPTVSPWQIDAALAQLGWQAITAEQLAGEVFTLAQTY